MAYAKAYLSVDMTDVRFLFSDFTFKSEAKVIVGDGISGVTYRGVFAWDYFDEVYGRLDSYSETFGGEKRFELTDIHRNATNFSQLAGDTDDAMAYILSGADTIDGSDHADRLLGFTGNDILNGNGRNDRLEGGAGSDRLNGGSGADLLFGGQGSDTLRGDTGKDTFYGNGGADVFAFTSLAEAGNGYGRDMIRDLQAGTDKIRLSGIDADTTRSGDQAFVFIGGGDFTGAAGQLRYTNGVISGDVNGDSVTDLQVEIANDAAIGASDFML